MKSPNSVMFKLGDRIECGKDCGSIKYIGLIQGKEHSWLGIDWDNPERGKHNGNVNGVQYFSARYPTSGSFIRPEVANRGISVLESIIMRYKQEEDELTAKINQQKQLKLQQSINAPFLEMVGFEKVYNKQSNLESLKVVNLREQHISSIGDLEELSCTCPNIEELDISKNLFSCWEDIFILCQQLRNLRWLNVSNNLMVFPSNIANYNVPNIKVLICGYMELTWDDIVKISNVFSHLEEIWAPFNNITNLSFIENNLEKLKTLELEGNLIEEWTEICKLNGAVNLEQLLIENIGLKCIRFDEAGPKVSIFKNLKKLCIVNNKISEWRSIAELNKLEKLENLKITKNPLMKTETKETMHQLLIANLENLKILNGVEIESGERRGAEYDYLKKYGLEWLQVKGTDNEEKFLTIHPLYLKLIKKYGEMEESELISPAKDIKHTLVKLKLSYSEKTVEKKLPYTMTVQKLEMLVRKLFRLENKPTLVYLSNEYSDIKIDLDDEIKDIGTYSMQDGDKILVYVL